MFLIGEKEGGYSPALAALARLLERWGIPTPGLIVTDRELALIKALNNSIWRSISYLLCRWHVNMNVLAKARRYFLPAIKAGNKYQRSPSFKAYSKEWSGLLASMTEADLKQQPSLLYSARPAP